MWVDNKFPAIKKILKNEKGSLLDLGCRDQILKKFLNQNINYTGVDITQNKAASNVIMDLNSDFRFEKNSFDYIAAVDVIEHIDKPLKVINECLNISKKMVIINLPNVAYYEFILKFALKGDLGKQYHFSGKKEDDKHCWFTNYHNINLFFKKNFSEYKIIPVFKTRNKLKILYFLEKFFYKLFPNLFCWSLIIILKPSLNN